MNRTPATTLRSLEELRLQFGKGMADRKVDVLQRLRRARLGTADEVLRLHEVLCYWRAYPENRAVLAEVEAMLASFDRRADLRRHRAALMDTGIAGTDLYFRFYWLMAIRMVRRWPEYITIDWADFEHARQLVDMLHLLLPFSETPALDDVARTAREWLDHLRGPDETDAAFLMRRFAALKVPRTTCEYLYEQLDTPVRLSPGADTPARTREKWDGAPVVYQKRPPVRTRPSLRRAARETGFQVRSIPPRRARELIDLANDAMVPRHRDLLVFLHADENDVRIVDFGDGLQFACYGTMPDRRLMLEAVYGFITLKNGVPIGYVLNSALFGSCELAYNVFDTFRGSEAARIYGRFLATVHTLFGADVFTIDPYQLGHGNREGQLSGAWWFYYKLGFRPRDPEIKKLVRKELARIRRDPSYRTPPETIDRLAADNMFLSLGKDREDVLGRVDLGAVGDATSRYLARRFGGFRERGIRTCAREAASLLGIRSVSALPAGERIAWDRWGPLVMAMPGVARWSAADRRALAGVIRAKGGRRESEFVRKFDAHRKLRRAIRKLAGEP